jgi:ribonuclease HI
MCESFEDAKWIAPEYQGERMEEIWRMKEPQIRQAPRMHPALVEAVQITLATDGASSKNPGPSGWGVVLKQGDFELELYGGQSYSTNNLMELRAVIEGLSRTPPAAKVHIITDSRYVKDGMTKWIVNWRKNGRITALKKPVKNQEAWKELDTLVQDRQVEWQWIKGHSGYPLNERADKLAVRCYKNPPKEAPQEETIPYSDEGFQPPISEEEPWGRTKSKSFK